MATDERRRHPRFEARVPARLEAGADCIEGEVHDICRDAVFVQAGRTWPTETELRLTLQLPGADGLVQLPGRVVRVSIEEGAGRGMAVLFTEVNPAAVARIDMFLARRG